MPHRRVCVHGHFYQPPRENPWTGAVEPQPSAAPYPDWNARVTAEAYAPNAAADTYARISFDVGPTLLAWLERSAPETYAAIVAADGAAAGRFDGHGAAIAQAFHHAILPLASPRDARTEVRWGIADFRHRFGREPEGMWLPETAVDLATLEVLAEEGIPFTVLAPHQAARVRGFDEIGWRDVGDGSIDTGRPYVQSLPSGRSIALLFYDGPASRAIAFEGLLESGDRLAERLLEAAGGDGEGPRLAHVATDGETYGHHHRHGEMALAHALAVIESRDDARLTVYGEFLAERPPTDEVEIREATSWSCHHGIDRWRADCGCSTGGEPGWNQAWRKPLRSALDFLRDALEGPWEEAAGAFFADPWAARDDSIEILLDPSDLARGRFFAAHARGHLAPAERDRALALLELQRNALMMYTSCGWFFSDVAGIETVQVLLYAARAVELARERLGVDFEEPFLARLEAASSNRPEEGTGRAIYARAVEAARGAGADSVRGEIR